jgi:His/Glu/Gln/Arg/opine family amino acid ABC transporter permease subunit
MAAGAGAVAAGFLVLGLLLLNGRTVDWSYYGSYSASYKAPVWRAMLEAVGLAIGLTAAAYAGGLGIGFAVGWARAFERPVRQALEDLPHARARAFAVAAAVLRRGAGRLADFYVDAVRGTPLLVQVLFIWSAVLMTAPPEWNLATRSMVAGALAMMFNTGGYQGEIFRAGMQSVPVVQQEAARAIGLSRFGTMRHIVLPQTLRLVVPPLTNEFIALFKASSLLFVIGVSEVTSVAKSLANFNPRIFEIFVFTVGLYLLVTVPLSRAVGQLERRYRIPGLGLSLGPA